MSRVRFEDVSSNSTKILYQTDGMLLREAMVDNLLSRYSNFRGGGVCFLCIQKNFVRVPQINFFIVIVPVP
jgi:hypothetical protein